MNYYFTYNWTLIQDIKTKKGILIINFTHNLTPIQDLKTNRGDPNYYFTYNWTLIWDLKTNRGHTKFTNIKGTLFKLNIILKYKG